MAWGARRNLYAAKQPFQDRNNWQYFKQPLSTTDVTFNFHTDTIETEFS